MEATLVICRSLHYSAALGVFGTACFQAAIAPPHLAEMLDRKLRSVLIGSSALLFVTALLWLGLIAGEFGGGWDQAIDPATLSAVLFDTGFGNVWFARLILAIMLIAAVAVGPVRLRRSIALLALALLASLGLVGHAVMMSGLWGWASRASQALHLVAAGFWLGSLIPLVLCLNPKRADYAGGDTTIALRRFSGIGHAAVALVVLTGAFNVGAVLGKWPTDMASPYQSLLLIKIGLVVAMVGLALINRYVLVPRLSSGALPTLRAMTIAEGLIGLGVIVLVSLFGTLPPL